MLNELEVFYKQNGILATKFSCKHKTECAQGCDKFTGPKSAFVSEGYENRLLPRLLFLSLDSGSGNRDAEKRLPHAVRSEIQEPKTNIRKLPKNRHWYRTHELAWYILRRFDGSLKVEDANNYFAHTNSAKCCMNKRHRRKANSVLFNNCQEYLKQELGILIPEIIVTQGNEAKKAILQLREYTIKDFDRFSSIINLNGNQTFWLHTYHPGNWGNFKLP